MIRIGAFILLGLFCLNLTAQEELSTQRYKEIAIAQFKASKPNLNPRTSFVLSEYQWGHSQAFPVRLFLLRCISENGQQFNEVQFFTDGTENIQPLSSAFGGFGVMSALKQGEALYITNSWGSGRHRSELYAIHRDEEGALNLFATQIHL